MITVDITYLIIGGVILFYLIYKNIEYKAKIAKPERIYIDSSGVAANPPQFIEVLQNKTINFLIGKEKIVISQITIGDGLTSINIIANLYAKLDEINDIVPGNKLDEVRLNVRKISILNLITKYLYKLSKPFAKNKRSYKKELFKTANNNCEKIFLICEQIFNYWIYIKKLKGLLSKGATLQMINGEGFTWNSYEMDLTGKTIITPRYG